MVRLDKVGRGAARYDRARLGMARPGLAWLGAARSDKAWQGMAWLGAVRRDTARCKIMQRSINRLCIFIFSPVQG